MAEPWLEYQQQRLPVPPAAPAGPWQEYQATAGPQSRMPPINQSREGGRFDRAMAGLKLSSEGVANYLEGQYGKGNVATDRNGSFYVKDKGEWIPFDSPAVNTKDVYDLSGLGVAAMPVAGAEALAARFAAPLAKAVGGGILGGAAGSGLQQAVGAATPGGDPMSPTARLMQLGLDAGAGGLGNLAGAGISRLGSGVRNTYLTQTGKADTPVARQGQAVSQYLGEPLTPGQISQRKSLLTLEGALRRSPTKAADIIQNLDERQFVAGRTRWNELMDKISVNPANAEMLGNQVMRAFDDTLKSARSIRETQARADFSALDTALGRRPIFTGNNTVQALDNLLGTYNVEGAAGDATKGLVRQLQSLRQAFAPTGSHGMPIPPKPKSALEMERLLASWGRAAQGESTPFGKLDAAEQKRISASIFGALNRDLDEVVQQSPSSDSVMANALRQARDNYRNNSAAIDEIRKSSIGQYLGFRDQGMIAPEHIADRVVGMKPSQIRQTFQLLDKADPDLAGAVKRHALEQAMFKAEPSSERLAERLGEGVVPEGYSPARLLGELAKNPVVEALSPQERFNLAQVNAAMQRLANRGGTEGSPTAPLTFAFDIAKNIAMAGVAGDLVGALKIGSMVLGPARLATAITSQDSAKALRTLTLPKPTREAVLGALATLGLMGGSRSAEGEDVRPFATPPTAATPPMLGPQ